MERHLTTSAVRIGKRIKGASTGAGADQINAVLERSRGQMAERIEPPSAPNGAHVWTHTLILTGELTHRSAHALEVELERLCDEGVSSITLDLRQLEHIDPIGVAVIAFRTGFCQRQGLGFTLIPGSRPIQRAFEHAGAEDLPFQIDEVGARRLRAPTPRQAFSRRM
jgi:anti-anti-sigma factor